MTDPTAPQNPDEPSWGGPGGPSSYVPPSTPAGPPPAGGAYGAPGYGPPSYGAPGYGAPGYGNAGWGGYGPQEHPQGTTILVLGILSLIVCGILGPFAWSMGNKALREIDASPGRYSNRGNVQAGRICGMISSILLILGVLAFILVLVVGATAGTSSGY